MTSKPSIQVIASHHFERSIKRLHKKYRRISDDINPLIAQLVQGETPGDQISGVKSTLFKVRVANSDIQRGKSGSYRVVYYLRTASLIFLVEIYSKSEQTDIRADELRRLLVEIEAELDTDE